MTITAKYATRCAACRQPIAPGQPIEWAQGSPVRHATCGTHTSESRASLRCSCRECRRGNESHCLRD